MAARLQYVTDEDQPMTYDLDRLASWAMDFAAEHPDTESVRINLPARDRAMALSLCRMAVRALEEF